MTEIVLAGCVLRPVRSGDEVTITRYAGNPKVWRNMPDAFPHPYSLADGERWVGSCEADDPPLQFAIVVEREVVGVIGLIPGDDVYRRSMEIGYWLGEPYWNRGLATEALRGFTAHTFETFDLDRLWAGVFAWNAASVRVLEKAGYEFEGRHRNAIFKDGEVTDELIYARIR